MKKLVEGKIDFLGWRNDMLKAGEYLNQNDEPRQYPCVVVSHYEEVFEGITGLFYDFVYLKDFDI